MKSAINKIDIFSFCATAQHSNTPQALQGKTPLSEFKRFLQGMLPQEEGRVVEWRIRPAVGNKAEQLVQLQVQTEVILQCQRCGSGFKFAIDSEQTVEIVATLNETVEDLDVDALLEEYEQVLGSTTFDVLGLVEDELVLSVPYVPRHEICPESDWLPSQNKPENDRAPSPFAILAALKNKSSE